jgi:hypothetical protein
MNSEVFDILKELLSWASGVALALVAWAWKTNAEEHKMLHAQIKEAADKTADVKQRTSDGYSTLNDRIMEHMDAQQREMRAFVMTEDAKLLAETTINRSHIAKIFDKIEAQAQRSEDRHVETLQAIHTLATTMHTALATKADKQ